MDRNNHPRLKSALFLGGHRAPGMEANIDAGLHPRAEYLLLAEDHRATIIDFGEPYRADSLWVRRVAERAGPYWGAAALACTNPGCWGHILTTGEDVGWPLALMQRATGRNTPVSIITHGSYLGSRKGRLALRLLRNASQVQFLCLSESLRSRLIQDHHIPAPRAVTVGYGVDTLFFQPARSVGAQARQIASAGTANRDYRTLVAATGGLNVSVKIAADSNWFQTDTDISGMPLPPNVEARSYGDYAGLRRLYAESSFVVVPLYEAVHACGYAVIAEAMAMGKPVITTDIAGRSDYIVEGETGFYVPPGDAIALRDRIQHLLDRPRLVAEMGRNARQLIEAHHTIEASNRRITAAAWSLATRGWEAHNEHSAFSA